jgi:N-acetyl-anhydromuramyl-L-alanine amidase AmpD
MANPLSLHISGPNGSRDGLGDWLARLTAAGTPAPVVYSINVNLADTLKRTSPTTRLIFRLQNETFKRLPGDMWQGDPVLNARRWINETRDHSGRTQLQTWLLNPATYYDPLNEGAPQTVAQAQWFCAWEIEALNIATSHGLKLALCSFQTGAPDYSLWQYLIPALKLGQASGAILSLHAYNNGGLCERDASGHLTPAALNNAFRHWEIYDDLPESARLPVVYTEASKWNGFGMGPTPEWINDLIDYGQVMKDDLYTLGVCAFQCGGNESNCWQALPAYGEAIVSDDWTTDDQGPTVESNNGDMAALDALKDLMNNVWELGGINEPAGWQILKNGAQFAGGWGMALLYWNKTLYTTNAQAEWYQATATGWIKVAGDPRLTVPPPAPNGWAPFATKRALTNGAYWPGRQGQTAIAVVLHSAEGPLSAIYPWFNRSGSNQSSHFGIGKDGAIEQYVSIVDSAWANGDVKSPHWSKLIPGVNPNLYTISIEMEGYSTEVRTAAMNASVGKVLRWVHDQIGLVYVPQETLIGHYQINSVDRANDPGPHVNYALLAQLGNGQPPAAPAWRGLHMRADGHSTQADFDCLRIGKLNAAKLMTNTGFDELAALLKTIAPDHVVLRLFWDGTNPALKDAARAFDEARAWLNEFARQGGQYVEIHNESNLRAEGMFTAWPNVAGWQSWYNALARLIRSSFPTIKIGWPGLSPQSTTTNEAIRDADFTPALQSSIAAGLVDWIGAHAYWQNVAQMDDPDHGRYYRRLMGLGRPVILTEFSNKGTTDDDTTKGAQYKAYYASLEYGVLGAFAFVSSASNPTFDQSRETWVRKGILSVIPTVVGS